MAFYYKSADDEIVELTSANDVPSDAPIGIILPFSGKKAPWGFVFCDGKEYSAIQYPELYELIGSKFGGSDNYTFCVPNLTENGRTFKQMNDDSTLLHKHGAYAPYVTGRWGSWNRYSPRNQTAYNGFAASVIDGTSGNGIKGNGTDTYILVGMKPSRSNPTYGRDPDVTVLRSDTLACPFIMKAKSMIHNEPLYQSIIKGNSLYWKYYEESL